MITENKPNQAVISSTLVTEWLCSEQKPHQTNIDQVLLQAAAKGRNSLVKLLCELTEDNKPSHEAIKNALRKAQQRGYDAIVSLLQPKMLLGSSSTSFFNARMNQQALNGAESITNTP